MTVPVYEWVQAGEPVGCGTRVELDHWIAEGVYAPGEIELGQVLTHEPASEDDRRRKAWARTVH